MGQSFYQQVQRYFQAFDARMNTFEQTVAMFNHVLKEVIGKELMRGQALHKVLMDKGLFTDAELKTALESIIAESKKDLQKMEEEAKAEKAKAVELLVPAGANLKPPVSPDVPPAPAEQPQQEAPKQEVPSAEPPAANG